MANISEDEKKRAWQAGFVFSATTVKKGRGYFQIGSSLVYGEEASIMVDSNTLGQIQKRGIASRIEFQKGIIAGLNLGEIHTPDTDRPLPPGINMRKILFGRT